MLEKARIYASTYEQKIRDIKQNGSKVIGYFCSLVPVELFEAAGFIPYRISGDPAGAVTEADSHLESIMCPYVRSCFDVALKGSLDFLDGIVIPHSCDSIERLYNIWRQKMKPEYSHFITVPHVVFPSSYGFFRNELEVFKESLERFANNRVSEDNLREAIRNRNHYRSLVRELYELRKDDPPLITGTEITPVLLAGTKLPVEYSVEALVDLIGEVRYRSDIPQRGDARLLIVGSELDDVSLIETIEESGASVVMDDTCTGSRNIWHDVTEDDDPLQALAFHYLHDIECPRTYRTGNAEERYAYLVDYARDFNCQGAVLDIIQYCDTYELDVPTIRDYLEESGVKVLVLDDSYSAKYFGQIKTRVQAFLELISQGE